MYNSYLYKPWPLSNNWPPVSHEGPPSKKIYANPFFIIMLNWGWRGLWGWGREIFSNNYTFEQHSQYYLLVLILFKTSNNQHDWTPVEYLHFLQHNRAKKQLLHWNISLTCKVLFIIFLLKSFMVKCLDFFLTPIPPNKIVSALKAVISSELLNTKIFVLHRQN